MEYTTLPSEASETSSRVVPDEWPASGKIEFANVTMRYRPELPLVLKRVSFVVQPQEKVFSPLLFSLLSFAYWFILFFGIRKSAKTANLIRKLKTSKKQDKYVNS
eukprot:Phypoly_transcript_26000.p1 GENE.Phypoly_transcript_26000~~Phypoly_transcript_26000.p1  ORF type:complete len:118 (+),score=12.62 Phypoly_transcript_26000:42-356(+)